MKKCLQRIYSPFVPLVLIGFFSMLSSCQKPEDEQSLVNSFTEDYDADVMRLTRAVSQGVAGSEDLRMILKHEAMKQNDGDYDIRLSFLMERRLSEYQALLKKSASDIRIKDLLTPYLDHEQLRRKSASSFLDDLLASNPDLQISVPVHCEDWDPDVYIPKVAFLRKDFNDGKTTSVDAFTSEGEMISISAVEEPSEPVLVVSLSERNIIPLPITSEGAPEVPENLTGTITESGIQLCWSMPPTATSANTTGYYIYRKEASATTYQRIGSSEGCFNRSYNDNAIQPAATYSYYVRSYYGSMISGTSNYITLTAPLKPKPVVSFDAIQISNKRIELRWQNDYSQSFARTELYRMRQGMDDDYQLYKYFDPSAHYCFDDDLTPGKKFTYKIHHRSAMGLSNPKYDFSIVPYRDISHPAPVYIQALKFTDWRIESWLAGKPEFFVTVGNVNLGTGKTYKIQENVFLPFGTRTNYYPFPDRFIFNWDPGLWYDMITFSVAEHDAGGNLTIHFSAGYNLKDLLKQELLPIKFGEESEYTVGRGSENCGCAYHNYYDVPDCWLRFPNYGVQLLISEKTFGELIPTGLLK